jgi:hypothetical protein
MEDVDSISAMSACNYRRREGCRWCTVEDDFTSHGGYWHHQGGGSQFRAVPDYRSPGF